MSRHNKNNGIPDRWLDYRAVGKRLHGTRFIAFKVPLKQSLNRKLPPADAFGPWELLDAVRSGGQELGLIVDLTFTTRYYRPQDVPESLMCVKIFTAGHQVPNDDTILSFKRAVRTFLKENAWNDKLIGVHCTHGLNRTGYLICRYLIDVDGMQPEDAVALFNSSRGHDIERQNYVDDLRRGPRRSNAGMDECEQEPVRGCSRVRPCYMEDAGNTAGARGPQVSTCHRATTHRSNHRRPHDGFHPTPPPQPPPQSRFTPPVHRYRWTPAPSASEWRRPERPPDSRTRYRPPEPRFHRPDHLLDSRRHAPPRHQPREDGAWAEPQQRLHIRYDD